MRAYEVKRGNGQFDAGKIRSIKRDLMCIQVLLKSYGETAKVAPQTGEAKIIFYYGVRSIPRPWSLVRDELDDHFGFPIVQRIEQANAYFKVCTPGSSVDIASSMPIRLGRSEIGVPRDRT